MPQDAISLLKQDHDHVRKLLDELTETGDRAVKTRKDLLEKVGRELRAHTRIEEEVLYPAFHEKGHKEEEKMYHEAMEEHRAVDDLVLPDLEKTDPGSREFAGRAKVLKELLEHHVEEEESEMFPKMRELFDDEQLVSMGDEMAQLKRKILH